MDFIKLIILSNNYNKFINNQIKNVKIKKENPKKSK